MSGGPKRFGYQRAWQELRADIYGKYGLGNSCRKKRDAHGISAGRADLPLVIELEENLLLKERLN